MTRRSGIVEALLETLSEEKPSPGKLVGRSIPLPSKAHEALVALDGAGQIHFLLAPAPIKISRFLKLKLKSLSIECRTWAVSGKPLSSYLDLSCKAGFNSPFVKPFVGLCEDIIVSMAAPRSSPEEAAFRTIQKWKRFWSSKVISGFTTEWLHGLHGELEFLHGLIKQYGSSAIRNWTGPDGQDHDFQGRQVAFEVKTSMRMPLSVQISNLGQLDNDLFDTLFMACFHVGDGEEGPSLPETVHQIAKLLIKDEEGLELFYEKLKKIGYNPRQEEDYEKFHYSLVGPTYFHIDEKFPRITQKSFKNSIDSRISKIKYSIELRGLKEQGEGSLQVRNTRSVMLGRT